MYIINNDKLDLTHYVRVRNSNICPLVKSLFIYGFVFHLARRELSFFTVKSMKPYYYILS